MRFMEKASLLLLYKMKSAESRLLPGEWIYGLFFHHLLSQVKSVNNQDKNASMPR